MTKNQKARPVYTSDPDIVSAIRRGDEPAFEQTFRKFYPRLCHYACTLLKDEDESEEVVQHVFLTIWEKREDLEITLSLKSYLYRAVHNHCLNRFKHHAVREAHREHTLHFVPQSYESVTEAIHASELEERIERAVGNLPEQCRKVFRLSRFEELKYQEIAARLEISVKTVENQIGKALKLLRTELADYLPSLLVFMYFVVEQLTGLKP
ncbi:RNA polymerase sigma-70 factor [Dyadobacter sandarakinus]|uniref:RNA polymerase sigma-70 factor n=1 Tax=Dyadobacter sandarakinus TaxID=2747268 RepID=A0ABX7IDT1_9BACT|nr:RNA polymerase sigma-70 factor [Dyadobacter sandarakinus]QRR03667.1 RNA polymerase sigma-70 factor [Dyadobacter sandarakinus]